MIPKIIHYCWLSDDPIPQELENYMNSWKKLQEYEFILWDRNRFDINSIAWTKQAFVAKKYAFAADYIRLYAVYTNGGIYLDMDIEIIKSFDSLLDNNIILAYENNNAKTIEAGCFGAEKECVYIKECLDYFKDRSFYKSDGCSYDIIPLPQIMKRVLNKPKFKDISIFQDDYFTARGSHSGTVEITNNTFCIHHFAGSWLTISEKKWKIFRKACIKTHGYITGSIIAFFYFFVISMFNGDKKQFLHHFRDAVNSLFYKICRRV
ncbi:glycosyl transferase [Spirochaetia bacterium]|nr:glycosyl transferase [Spirochaetia bacterium]